MTDFLGVPGRVLGEAVADGDHEHRVRLVEYTFPDGTVTPFVEVRETRPGYTGHRRVHLADVVHVLLNVGEMELFQVGNRERDYQGAATQPPSADHHLSR